MRAGNVPLLAVPWYAHPLEDGWHELAAYGSRLSFVVLNVNNGPALDPAYQVAIVPLLRAGIPLIGYVDTGYGRTPARQVAADIQCWLGEYPVTGIFLDSVASGRSMLDRYRIMARIARTTGATSVVGNPGTVPDPGYLDLFDVTCVFEGSRRTYFRDTPRPTGAPARICHLVHSAPRDSHRDILRRAADSGAGHVWISERTLPHPWGVLPQRLVAEYDAVFGRWGSGVPT